MSKFVIPLLLLFLLLLAGAVPHTKKHVKFSDTGSSEWDADKSSADSSNLEPAAAAAQECNGTTATKSSLVEDEVSLLKKGACNLETIWYYAFPFLVYFLLVVLAVLLALGVINLCLCLRRGCPLLMPCDITLCHRTTVTEEKDANCQRKDKLQLSLVNVNKHYYKLEGQDIP